MLLAMFALQWDIVVESFINLIYTYGANVGSVMGNQWLLDITTMIKADFAAAAVLISMGGVLGKLTHSQMLFMAFWEVIF